VNQASLERVECPYCKASSSDLWCEERGFGVVRCRDCRFLYVNPRPSRDAIDRAVRSGVHGAEAQGLQVASRRVARKVAYYRQRLQPLFSDRWEAAEPLSWLDVGAGYGEFLEAVQSLAPSGSQIRGLEPMRPKAMAARARGLNVIEAYLDRSLPAVDVVSLVDVFSHVADFRALLGEVRAVLSARGELFLETGNLADLNSRSEFPGELGVPDHLVFGGELHLRGFLSDCGFEILRLESERADDWRYFSKSVVKRLLGRPEHIRMPYTSSYRQILLRARRVD
jgi:SAM-dependent methyltransferase